MTQQLIQLQHFFALPRERVFAYFVQHDNFGRLWWPAQCRWIKAAPNGDANGVGSVREIRVGLVRFEETTTEITPDSTIEYRVTRGGPFKNHVGRMRFSEVPGGTQLDYDIAFDCRWPLFGNFVSGVMHAAWLRGVNRAVDRLMSGDR
ncbi:MULTISPECIES: SRPBCC family protein [Hydrocarboniphaga]|jgi:uncharacterized protein YndB with AHSA1/START domain|uniref:Polyketide cyclase/dehydrase n=1 Tax=Hydrocarboniphaga effusa AP103 TaxID=1172194 RepID=I8I2P8_9GAMM|nr:MULTISPECIES: SRPBCC family protein [Hydrocarboniphaga]EIT70014.1 hypothetical protein WQQ_01510 [Hydrocarboniphaga effusa AP103]EIT70201.1 hypothetical protein WQQ_03380 [Hydrocarboniphaga effusa AP103]MDZ4077169.1 SRPBCC family protein [Hydrocarboniphaga sp.]